MTSEESGKERPKVRGLWSIKTVAAFLEVHQKTVRRWWQAGILPPPRKLPGRLVRWDAQVIEAWVKEQPEMKGDGGLRDTMTFRCRQTRAPDHAADRGEDAKQPIPHSRVTFE